MSSRVQPPSSTPNFKRPRADRLKEKTRDKHDDREGNSSAHLALIRQLPCCICGKRPGGQAHHLKATGLRGAGMRSPDKCAVPMCEECHLHGVERAGSKNELAWFSKRGIEALDFAAALWTATGDYMRMFKVALEHMASKPDANILNTATNTAPKNMGDGVALASVEHPDGLIEKIAEAIVDGRLNPLNKGKAKQ